jgi:xanthine dehydrogenase YagS FAD-binding subunit
VSVAAALSIAGDGSIAAARLALGGVAHRPWRRTDVEADLVGRPPSGEAFEAAADALLDGARGQGDNDFKIPLARRAIVRALEAAAAGGPS